MPWTIGLKAVPFETGLKLRLLIVVILSRRDHVVHRSGHQEISLAIVPQDAVQDPGIDGVRPREIHLGRLLGSARVRGIDFVDQTILQIARVGGEWWLVSFTGKLRSEKRSVCVIKVHRGQAQQRLDRVNHADSRENAMMARATPPASAEKCFWRSTTMA